MGPHSQKHGSTSDPENPFFSGNLFLAFFASMDLLRPQGHPRMDRNCRIHNRIREIRSFENPFLSFFRFFKLKPLQYGCLWTPLDPTQSAVPVLRYFCGTFSVLDAFLSLNPLQNGFLWTPLDPRSLVPVPRYCGTFSVLNGTFSVLNGTFSVQLGCLAWSAWLGWSGLAKIPLIQVVYFTKL